jgi:hypothetical protein
MKTICLRVIAAIGTGVLWSTAIGQEKGLPSDSLDLIEKLQQFENEERQTAREKISEKRKAVVEVLEQHLTRETKLANLDSALELRKLIENLKQPIQVSGLTTSAEAKNTTNVDFLRWAESIEIHEDDGWWEIDGPEIIQHPKGGGERRYKHAIDREKEEVSFVANGRKYTFRFVGSQTMGIRSRDDDWPPRICIVKPKR